MKATGSPTSIARSLAREGRCGRYMGEPSRRLRGMTGSIVPYFEIGGGTLFTTHDVPTGTGATNFTTTAALGFHHIGQKITWSLDARYMHISNAGLATPNPGINTFQVRLGLGKFGK